MYRTSLPITGLTLPDCLGVAPSRWVLLVSADEISKPNLNTKYQQKKYLDKNNPNDSDYKSKKNIPPTKNLNVRGKKLLNILGNLSKKFCRNKSLINQDFSHLENYS